MSKQRGFHRTYPERKQILRSLNPVYILILSISLVIFAIYEQVLGFFTGRFRIDLFGSNIDAVALYFLPIDPQLSNFLLEGKTVAQDYLTGKNIFQTQSGNLQKLVTYFKKNKDYIVQAGLGEVKPFLNLVYAALDYEPEVFDLLGAREAKNYLIILQNTAEKRPNGGFFGSFAFVQIKHGGITQLEIIDSYFPNFISPGAHVSAPERSRIIGSKTIGFLSTNRFGFTSLDGYNVKTLYETIFNGQYDPQLRDKVFDQKKNDILFNKTIHGVIFIRSDLMEFLVPNIKEKLWERQFANASIDIIRGSNQSHKKQIYIQQVTDFFEKNKIGIAKSFVNAFEEITRRGLIQIYLPHASTGLQKVIDDGGLRTRFDNESIFVWDSNVSYNKIDQFLSKNMQIIDGSGKILSSSDTDIISVKNIDPGKYTLRVQYSVDVPEYYHRTISGFIDQYKITLTPREYYILGLTNWNEYRGNADYIWKTESLIYSAKSISLTPKDSTLEITYFNPPFAKGIKYATQIQNNHQSRVLEFTLIKQ